MGNSNEARVIGVDPGTRFTGYGVVDVAGNRLSHVSSGRISAPSDWPLPRRLHAIHTGLSEVIAAVAPTEAALETVFASQNAQSSLKLGHARGVAMLALFAGGLAIAEYTPGEIKRAVVGNGRADKGQVQHMVKALLGLPALETEDASDALAAAICRCQQRRLPLALQGARRLPARAS